MNRILLHPFELDRLAAKFVREHARSVIERPTRLVTLLADEHAVTKAMLGIWLVTRFLSKDKRRLGDDGLVAALGARAVSHILKAIFAKERPDRAVVKGHRHGIPKSGKPFDSFPSGHAAQAAAVASVVSRATDMRMLSWGAASLLSATRLVLLAHWPSDVAAGLTIGAAVEALAARLCRSGDD